MTRFCRLPHAAFLLFLLLMLLWTSDASAQGLSAVTVTSSTSGAKTYSVTLQILAMMTALTVLPALLITMTSFTRVIIVLAILRQAIGLGQTPTNQILLGIALFLTIFIMAPVFQQVNQSALQPYLQNKVPANVALANAEKPMKQFLLQQTRQTDLDLFAKISGNTTYQQANQLPLSVLLPAFLTSELKTAFQIGFLLFLPFLIIDFGCSQCIDVNGYDDAIATDYLTAV